uniref:Coiled-coil domain-containing protein 25 n=2 Tax=Timema TaxID=61471 RepID=A0A7R9E3Q2_9NEOP|nr:unnamed protein product [Timema monikensis]
MNILSGGDGLKMSGSMSTNFRLLMFICGYCHLICNMPIQGQTIHDIPKEVLDDAAQLVKANSIQGNKMNDIDVVYTMWSNLKKTDGMEAGQVSFHEDKEAS